MTCLSANLLLRVKKIVMLKGKGGKNDRKMIENCDKNRKHQKKNRNTEIQLPQFFFVEIRRSFFFLYKYV